MPPNLAPAARLDPTVALIFGAPKTGKTLDAIYAFPDAVFIAAQGALKGAEAVARYAIDPANIRHASTARAAADEAKKIADANAASNKKRKVAMVIDDLTLVTDNSVRAYQNQGITKWDLYRMIRNDLLDLRQTARAAGMYVIFTCHEREPRYEEIGMAGGGKQRILRETGGPNLPGQMRQGLPAICDLVLRAEKGDQFTSFWPIVYRNLALDPRWIGVGIRELPPIDPLPMNLAEILRSAGHFIAEPFAGHSDLTSKLAGIFAANPNDMRKLAEGAFDKIRARVIERGAAANGYEAASRTNWILRDALARAQVSAKIEGYFARPMLFGGTANDEGI